MKLAKLSLAAIMAVGALSTANATPLEEAIKGVELKGFVRYRFYNESDRLKDDRHRFSAPFTFVMPVADGLKTGVTVRFEGSDYADNSAINGSLGFDAVKAWFQYSNKSFTLKGGRFEIATPLTNPGYGGTKGDGLLATVALGENFTFAAAAFTATNVKIGFGGAHLGAGIYEETTATPIGDLGSSVKNTVKDAVKHGTVGPFKPGYDSMTGKASYSASVGEENLYAAAILGAVGPVNLQAWAFNMEHVIDFAAFVQADAKFGGFDVKAQYTQVGLDGDVEKTLTDVVDGDGIFYGVQAGFGMDKFHVGAGYTATDKDNGVVNLSPDDSLIKAGKQMYYEYNNLSDIQTYFATADMTFGKVGVGAGYVAADGGKWNVDGQEIYGQVSYAYSKNFNMNVYYSAMTLDDYVVDAEGGPANLKIDNGDNNEIRFEAKYSF